MKKLLILLALITAHARAWDGGGHMLVGEIAWQLSTPHVREAVEKLVATLDNQFNAGQPYNFTTAGCWMDDLRSLPKKDYPWSAWHYVDAERTADGKAFKLPAPPHIVWAISENLKTLRDPAAPDAERAKALGMLLHWVGDIHQPLHATTWDDRGGNGYLISGVPFSDLMPGQVANLHTYWDKAFRFDIREDMIAELWAPPKPGARAPAGQGIIAEEARELLKRFPKDKLPELALPPSAEAWARESHILGSTKAYPPGEHPRDTGAPRLTLDFVRQSYEISGRRVVIAGHRLAALLAELFPEK